MVLTLTHTRSHPWCCLCCTEMFEDCPNTRSSTGQANSSGMWWFARMKPGNGSQSQQLARYEFVGAITGMAVRQDMLVPVSLPSLVWRPIVGLPVTERDVERIAEEFMTAVAALRKLSPVRRGRAGS